MRVLSLRDCLGLNRPDRKYYVSGQDINPATGKQYAINPASGVWDDNYFAANFGNKGGGNSGGSRLDFVKGLTDNLLNTDAANASKVNDARGALIDYYKNLPKSVDTFKNLNEEYGVTAQQKLVDSLTKDVMQQQDTYDAIPASVIARSGDFLINDADKTAITAREQKPVLDNLNKLLRNKQYEEVGLAGKQALVSQLLQMTLQDQEAGAKPLQLGVDYTTEDRKIANDLLSSVLGVQSSAFNSDQDSRDADRRAAEDRAFQEMMFDKGTARDEASQSRTFAQQDKVNAQDFAQQLQLKSMSAGTSAANKAQKEAEKVTAQKTEDAWNKIVAGSKTEYDVWKKINQNQKTLASQGVDVAKLWSEHSALAAKVGTGGSIRSSSSGDGL